MLERLKQFENKKPEIIFEWKDPFTEAIGWVVINSLRGGAAGGGTRMRKGLDEREVESLAKTMEIKFTVSGPAIGGAKSGINFDPTDPRKPEVLQRWFKAVYPLLKNYYGTGGDLHIDEIHEVIPVTDKLGLLHPQEGVVNGHFHSEGNDKQQRIEKLQHGVSKIVTDKNYLPQGTQTYRVADLITGYGVASSVLHYYKQRGETVNGKKVFVQGWGNVGAAAGFYLSKEGAIITAILDHHLGVINEKGFDHTTIEKLINDRQSHLLQGVNAQLSTELRDTMWKNPVDIFIPAASSRLVQHQQLEHLINNGLELIACGANVPFADKEIFVGPIAAYADSKVSVIPDFIANCGMARVFAYLMSNPDDMSDKGIFSDVDVTIANALQKITARNTTKTGITATGFDIALEQLI